jgi:CvfB-like winged helix domain
MTIGMLHTVVMMNIMLFLPYQYRTVSILRPVAAATITVANAYSRRTKSTVAFLQTQQQRQSHNGVPTTAAIATAALQSNHKTHRHRTILLSSIRNSDNCNEKPSSLYRQQHWWRSASTSSFTSGSDRKRYPSVGFTRSKRDAIQDGIHLLARSESNRDRNETDTTTSTGSSRLDDFDLSSDIPEVYVQFRVGLPILVEVLSFGPLGASVAVIGMGHDTTATTSNTASNTNTNTVQTTTTTSLTDTTKPLATGIIYQSEIRYFRDARHNVDVVRGEILKAYVERVRDDGKIDVSLRLIGGRAKVDKWSGEVLQRLEEYGELPVGDRSTPVDIAREFPGMSKSDYKKCLGSLFERRMVYPFPFSVLPYQQGLAIETARREQEAADAMLSGTNEENGNSTDTTGTSSTDRMYNSNNSYNNSNDSYNNSNDSLYNPNESNNSNNSRRN